MLAGRICLFRLLCSALRLYYSMFEFVQPDCSGLAGRRRQRSVLRCIAGFLFIGLI